MLQEATITYAGYEDVQKNTIRICVGYDVSLATFFIFPIYYFETAYQFPIRSISELVGRKCLIDNANVRNVVLKKML